MRNRYQMMHDRTREGYKRENDLIRINNIIREHPEIIPTELRGQVDEMLPYGLEGLISGKDPIGFTLSGLDRVFNYNGHELSLIDIIAPANFTGKNRQVYKDGIAECDAKLEQLTKTREAWEQIGVYESKVAYEGAPTEYDPSKMTAQMDPLIPQYELQTPEWKRQQKYQAISTGRYEEGLLSGPLAYMNDDQVNTYTALFNLGMHDEAEAYLEALKSLVPSYGKSKVEN